MPLQSSMVACPCRSSTSTRPLRTFLELVHLEDRQAPAGLGVAANFNAFVFSSYTASSTDTGGRLAVGGDATLTNYSIGSALPNSHGTRDDLIVGGNLSYTNGQVFTGNAIYGGTASFSAVGLPGGTALQGNRIDFGAAATALAAESAYWSSLAANATTADHFGSLALTGSDPNLNVFTVSGAVLSSANGLTIAGPAGSTVLVNVSGTSDRLENMGMSVAGTDRQHVLFNFYEATSLQVAGISVQGSVLAPGADVRFDNGNLEGTLVARSLSGGGEFHLFPSLINLP